MEESIFLSIKGMIGPDASYTVFDPDILIHINTALATLTQLGVGPASGFRVTGAEETWSDFLGDSKDLDSAKSYVYMKVKMIFDPPANSFVMDAYKKACDEIEWRLNVVVDPSRLE